MFWLSTLRAFTVRQPTARLPPAIEKLKRLLGLVLVSSEPSSSMQKLNNIRIWVGQLSIHHSGIRVRPRQSPDRDNRSSGKYSQKAESGYGFMRDHLLAFKSF